MPLVHAVYPKDSPPEVLTFISFFRTVRFNVSVDVGFPSTVNDKNWFHSDDDFEVEEIGSPQSKTDPVHFITTKPERILRHFGKPVVTYEERDMRAWSREYRERHFRAANYFYKYSVLQTQARDIFFLNWLGFQNSADSPTKRAEIDLLTDAAVEGSALSARKQREMETGFQMDSRIREMPMPSMGGPFAVYQQQIFTGNFELRNLLWGAALMEVCGIDGFESDASMRPDRGKIPSALEMELWISSLSAAMLDRLLTTNSYYDWR